jgi:hypothetical protein
VPALSLTHILSRARALTLSDAGARVVGFRLARALRLLEEHPRAVIEPDAAPVHAPREGREDILKFSACINAPVHAPREGQEEVNDVA